MNVVLPGEVPVFLTVIVYFTTSPGAAVATSAVLVTENAGADATQTVTPAAAPPLSVTPLRTG